MSSSPLARHWQWVSIRVRRTRRAVPSLLFVLFVIAVASILFFPDLDVSSFASRSSKEAVRQGEQVWKQHVYDHDRGSPPQKIESPFIPEAGTGKGSIESDPVIKNITKLRRDLREHYKIDSWRAARAENDVALERLGTCLQAGSCGPGEDKVVLLATFHFAHAKLGKVSGEDIWARSSLEAFTALNYTLLFTYGHMDTLMIYQHIPDLVKIIIWESAQMKRCMARDENNFNSSLIPDDEMSHSPDHWQKDMKKGCMKRKGFEDGIPLWKGFTFHFWPTPSHPLGERWTLAPYDYKDLGKENLHLGYSIQEACEKAPLVEKKKHRAIVLGKRPEYFSPEKLAWPNMLPEIARDISPVEFSTPEGDDLESFQFVGAYSKNKNTEVISNAGVNSVGLLSMDGWFEAVGASKAMLGVGEPYHSPSPFDGLCQGTPFINVIRHWDKKDPENKKKWRTQHDTLISTGAPYIYHVRSGDKEDLERAVQSAVDNPIGRYIPPSMTRESVRERHRLLVETDWEKVGALRIGAISNDDESFPFIP